MSHTLGIDFTDKDSVQHTKSPVLLSPQLQHESVQDSLDCPMKQYYPQCNSLALYHGFSILSSVIGFIVKEWEQNSHIWLCFSEIVGCVTLQVNQDLLPRFICLTYLYDETECQHSRQASSTTVDDCASQRLSRYSDVLETISKD